MNETIEIRWHGRGGQGTVTAAKVFAESCLHSGKHVQAFPEYGPERSGAPVQAYNRISSHELRQHCPVIHPHVVVIVDTTLIEKIVVSTGMMDNTYFLLNACTVSDKTKETIGLKKNQKIFCVDATGIALDTIGRNLPNSPMVGALAKISGLSEFEPLLKNVEKSFGKKFSPKVVEGNLIGLKRGWEEVREV